MPTIKARATFTGTSLDLDRISRVVGVPPTKTWRAGDPRSKSSLTYQEDGWSLELPSVSSFHVGEQIERLCALLTPAVSEVRRLSDEFDLEVSCDVWIDDQAPSVTVSRAALRDLAALGASLDLDLFV